MIRSVAQLRADFPRHANELANSEERYREAVEEMEHWRERRNLNIRDAFAAGWTQTEVATFLGLSRGRVAQIASKGD